MLRNLDENQTYKGYTIEPAPGQLYDSTWDSTFIIFNNGNPINEEYYCLPEVHTTRDEAVRFCLARGREIIDAKN